MERIVIKVGSNVLTRPDGTLDVTRMSSIVDQVAALRKAGLEIILVSSGAVACGRSMVKVRGKLDSVEQRQLFSSVGQTRLVNLYFSLFREYGITVGQVLTMKENFATRKEYLNQRSCMEVMLSNGVIPIVNENDTVSVTELMFTDNDELSGLVATMMQATRLIILSNVDGIYDSNPSKSGARILTSIKPGDDLSGFIYSGKSSFGRGGMITKTAIAQKVAQEGIAVTIANGKRDGILISLVNAPDSVPHTDFVPQEGAVSSVKKWIAHSEGFSKGVVTINTNAVKAIAGRDAASLLMVGVLDIEGDFEEGDIIRVASPEGKVIAYGRSAYAAEDARAAIGKHEVRPLIHYDYLYMV